MKSRTLDKETPLHIAADNYTGKVVAKFLVDSGADTYAQDKFGYTPKGYGPQHEINDDGCCIIF